MSGGNKKPALDERGRGNVSITGEVMWSTNSMTAEREAVREVKALAPEAPGRADRDRGGAALLLMELAAMLERCESLECLEQMQLAATLSGGRVMIVDIH